MRVVRRVLSQVRWFSAGLGLRLQLGSQVTARLDWGIPLTSISGAKSTWQENGVYFSLTALPF